VTEVGQSAAAPPVDVEANETARQHGRDRAVDGSDETGPAPDGGPEVGTAADADVVPAVRDAEDRLAAVDVTGTPAATHVATYDEVHAVLQDALADLDER
jgi:hypothetical protein